MKNSDKTNVMRVLDGKKIPYVSHVYTPDPALSGQEIAALGRRHAGCLRPL